jgi:hypothetical protein
MTGQPIFPSNSNPSEATVSRKVKTSKNEAAEFRPHANAYRRLQQVEIHPDHRLGAGTKNDEINQFANVFGQDQLHTFSNIVR